MATIIYLIFAALIFWAYFGYPILLHLIYMVKKPKPPVDINEDLLTVSVVIPLYNEEAFIERKVENIKELDYPRDRLRVYFVDGNSTDNSVNNLNKLCKGLEYVKIVEAGGRGKINQINYILPRLDSELVINTDMDAMLEKDVIKNIVKVFNSDEEAYVVGAFTLPKGALTIEEVYWRGQNYFRRIESDVYASSIVLAPCYAFRAKLLAAFPEDCVADDVYVSFLANTLGKKTKYIKEALVHELRTPRRFAELLKHKFRKGNAYVTEVLRFAYRFPRMRTLWKIIFFTKLSQVAVLPWVIPLFFLASISFILNGPGTQRIAIFALAFLLFSCVVTHIVVSQQKIKEKLRYAPLAYLEIFIITNLILILAGITYPFYKNNSEYNKINVKN